MRPPQEFLYAPTTAWHSTTPAGSWPRPPTGQRGLSWLQEESLLPPRRRAESKRVAEHVEA